MLGNSPNIGTSSILASAKLGTTFSWRIKKKLDKILNNISPFTKGCSAFNPNLILG